MSWELLRSNWALVIAGILGALVAFSILVNLMRRSARGQLRRTRSELSRARRTQRSAAREARKAEQLVEKLSARRENVKPRILTEAAEALEDARSLAKIADDKVLIAENHVRRVIVGEFPPKKHERMRQRYLSGQQEDKDPFHFDR